MGGGAGGQGQGGAADGKSTGDILYEEHGEEPLELASVTKVMTMLLIMEALEDGTLTPDTMVAVSANAAGMGGSQVYMKEGETFSVHDMLKAIARGLRQRRLRSHGRASGRQRSRLVERMNARAAELGMENTVFCNCTGLPAEGHHSTAHDIALMSRELILKHPDIRTYTTIWMDTLREGSFQLANTNKLIRFYDGATGLKTGSTDGALYCISATAEKDGMELIAVVLGSPTSADRFEAAKALLNYGFAGYSLVTAAPSEPLSPIPVTLGVAESVQPVLSEPAQLLLPKADAAKLTTTVSLPDTLQAPVEAGPATRNAHRPGKQRTLSNPPPDRARTRPRLTLWQVFREWWGCCVENNIFLTLSSIARYTT